MHHPTFSAEKAVYRSGTSYVSHGRNAVYRAEVVPAQAPVPLAGGEAGSIGEVAGGILGALGVLGVDMLCEMGPMLPANAAREEMLDLLRQK
jgi:hypothetical protein